MSSRFEGKVAIVTGAVGTIGRAVSRRFADEGGQVALVDIDAEGLKAAAAERPGAFHAVQADVADEAHAERLVAEAVERFGGVDVLVNNAGIVGRLGTIADLPVSTFDQVLRVNVRGTFLASQRVVPALRARGGGAIVNVSSIAGLIGGPPFIAYSASKHAVIGLTRSSALALVSDGIRVNAVCPAPIEGHLMDEVCAGLSPDDPAAAHAVVKARIPAGRYGTADEVAALVAFLASDDASFITGSVHAVDGGVLSA